jgi:predicted Fe-Mo cluster-binding NifX family protein
MRIAVSALDNDGLNSRVSPHFGRCPYFVLADIDGQEIESVRTVSNPHYSHHQPGQVPAFIQSQEVDVMLTGGMGGRALGFFRSAGIQPVTGANGTVEQALQQFFDGELSEAGPCRESVEHQHGHTHEHT